MQCSNIYSNNELLIRFCNSKKALFSVNFICKIFLKIVSIVELLARLMLLNTKMNSKYPVSISGN